MTWLAYGMAWHGMARHATYIYTFSTDTRAYERFTCKYSFAHSRVIRMCVCVHARAVYIYAATHTQTHKFLRAAFFSTLVLSFIRLWLFLFRAFIHFCLTACSALLAGLLDARHFFSFPFFVRFFLPSFSFGSYFSFFEMCRSLL